MGWLRNPYRKKGRSGQSKGNDAFEQKFIDVHFSRDKNTSIENITDTYFKIRIQRDFSVEIERFVMSYYNCDAIIISTTNTKPTPTYLRYFI